MPDFEFFQLSDVPVQAMSGYYNINLVVLSYIMAILASYLALEIAASLRQATSSSNEWLLVCGGAFAMGAGIFTMHFIGMQAFILPMPMDYDFILTVGSLGIAILASGFAFLVIKDKPIRMPRLIFGGIILGLAIASMHYTGMYAMLQVEIHYFPGYFFLSITIAIVASIAALWCMLQSERELHFRLRFFKILSAFTMGIGICGMHYVGMEAAVILPLPASNPADQFIFLSSAQLTFMTAYTATMIMVVTLLINSRQLILVKLLTGSLIIVFFTVPLAFFSVKAIGSVYHSIESIKNINGLIQLQKNVNLLYKETFFFVLWMMILIALFSMILSLFFSLQISKRIFQLRDSTKKVAKGDLTQQVSVYLNDEIGQLGKNFNAMVNALAESKKKEDEFISMVSHELRTPLTSINTSLGLLVSKGPELTNVKDLLNIAFSNSKRLTRLIEDLLDMGKAQNGLFKIEIRPTPLASVIKESMEFIKPLSEKSQINIVLEKSLPYVYVNGNHERLVQVMENLLSNAIKFSFPNSSVFISTQMMENTVKVSVRDQGKGIPLEFQPFVFEKFARAFTGDAHMSPGMGLGLSICKHIIDQCGGKIEFTTQEKGGTIFSFELMLVSINT